MKSTSEIIIFIFTFWLLTASGYAQTQAEQFKTAVVDNKKNPTNESSWAIIFVTFGDKTIRSLAHPVPTIIVNRG